METFNRYDFLWKANLQKAYDQFMQTNPTLEMFEAELKKYMAIETEVNAIAGIHNIGALSLDTQPLKSSLKSEAASWKAQFAQNLHKQCSEDLKAFDGYIRCGLSCRAGGRGDWVGASRIWACMIKAGEWMRCVCPSPSLLLRLCFARRDTTLKLNRKIEDLEDVRGIMNVLKEVREKDSEIDNLIGPIEEMYGLLGR